jgi:MoaA/NifB/PqqE/SkfB family radical SAM enzyme
MDEIAAIAAALENDEGITGQPTRASAFDPNAPSLSNTFTKTFCPRPFSEVMIRNQDEVLPCPWHTEVMGRLSEGKDLLQIFQGAKFQKLRGDMLRPEGAPGCRHCPLKQDLLPQTLREFAS